MPTAVVTGANSGIGNGLARILVKEGYHVIGADITIGEPIQKLGCQAEQLDVASPDSIQAFKQKLGDQPIDLLLNVAGVMVPPESDTLTDVTFSTLTRIFNINTFGPILLTQALLSNLRASTQPKVAVMSSRMGSISDNSSGGLYAYRGSKAAVNSLFKSLAIDVKEAGVAVVLLHPGIVKTNIGVSAEGGVEPEEAASELWKVLVSKGIEDSGRWWHRNGEELPW